MYLTLCYTTMISGRLATKSQQHAMTRCRIYKVGRISYRESKSILVERRGNGIFLKAHMPFPSKPRRCYGPLEKGSYHVSKTITSEQHVLLQFSQMIVEVKYTYYALQRI